MSSPVDPQALPLAAEVAREDYAGSTNEQTGPLIGASDAEADAVRSGAPADLTRLRRDSDGEPVGEAELLADKLNSGVRKPEKRNWGI